jgi:hypothetical protein
MCDAFSSQKHKTLREREACLRHAARTEYVAAALFSRREIFHGVLEDYIATKPNITSSLCIIHVTKNDMLKKSLNKKVINSNLVFFLMFIKKLKLYQVSNLR